jgi:hypothetical protein
VEIPLAELELKARALGINDTSGFLSSAVFAREGFVVDRRKKAIVRDL